MAFLFSVETTLNIHEKRFQNQHQIVKSEEFKTFCVASFKFGARVPRLPVRSLLPGGKLVVSF